MLLGLLFLVATLPATLARPGSAQPWDFANIGLRSSQALEYRAAQLLAGQRATELSPDRFECVEPSDSIISAFKNQYNRTFRRNDQQERVTLFVVTLKRVIMLNRILQNEVVNASHYQEATLKKSVGNYHFISPGNQHKFKLWYADINDCELGLIKPMVFDIFRLIDGNELELAYKVALDNSAYLPVLSADGMEQLANILLIRLYDRFEQDEKMNQLFAWPVYLKKLAAFAYNRRQMAQPRAKEKLSLVSFAYPAYFSDLKYNMPAINRTQDNLKMHADHEKFNKLLGRKFASRDERNRRLAIFRRTWTYVNLLNEEPSRWRNLSYAPDWQRADPTFGSIAESNEPVTSERLRLAGESEQGESELAASQLNDGRFKHTQFSDLTDPEFVAYLSNDFSLLGKDAAAANYIEKNFPVRQLDEKFRNEVATELELRRMTNIIDRNPSATQSLNGANKRESLAFARQVLDELISEVGLPVGPLELTDIPSDEITSTFNLLTRSIPKSYMRQEGNLPTESELRDERKSRLEQFSLNYPRFRAWWLREGWQGMTEGQAMAVLRLADMSWLEIKLSLFKICCLSPLEQKELAEKNTTIHYLASNDFLCKPLVDSANPDAADLRTLELYYYYSVHFNKHHLNMDDFERRLDIFRHNLEQIRRQSCMRSLSLFNSLNLQAYGLQNTIDVTDPRRSRTDDINLDRFKYFEVANLNKESGEPARLVRLRTERPASQPEVNTRAGISYRRSPFGSLLQSPQELSARASGSAGARASRAEQLSSENLRAHSTKYRELGAERVYDLVHQRYRFCMRALRNIEMPDDFESQNLPCKSSGPLGDKAFTGNGLNVPGIYSPAASLARDQQENTCSVYMHGLEPWKEGLIGQDMLSPQLIATAKC